MRTSGQSAQTIPPITTNQQVAGRPLPSQLADDSWRRNIPIDHGIAHRFEHLEVIEQTCFRYENEVLPPGRTGAWASTRVAA